MGGAFIAVADDATAASWNPGGLIQLETPEISFVGAGFHRSEDLRFGTSPEASGEQSITAGDINYLSVAWPFLALGRNMIVSLNYQTLYDFNREWTFSLKEATPQLSLSQQVGFRMDGDLSAVGFAYCVQVTPTLSIGATLNWWEDPFGGNQWKERRFQGGTGTFGGNEVRFEQVTTDVYDFSGINFNFGLLWNATPKLTVGAVLKTPFDAELKHRFTSRLVTAFPDIPALDSTESETASENASMTLPLSVGIGAAWRFSDAFSASMDLYHTRWDRFAIKSGSGKKTSPVTGQDFDASDISPTVQVRLGAEYLFIREGWVIPVRGGVFYDPLPGEGSPDSVFGVSVGSGVVISDRPMGPIKSYAVDAAYQYRFGRDTGSSILNAWDFSQDINEHTLYVSAILHF